MAAPAVSTERPTPPPTAADTRFFGHPRGLSTLFFTEMWERFSYYGMRALLILFMTASVASGGLGIDTGKAAPIYAMYVSSVYLLSLPGGWLADRVLGLRRAVLVGAVTIMLGHVSLAIPSVGSFYLGLVLVAVGTGLLKPNVSVLVGQLYTPDDVRRDAGYSIYYMGINLGGFIAPLVCGWLAQSAGFRSILAGMDIAPESAWHWGFGAAAVGMLIGIVQYVAGGKHLAPEGLKVVRPADPVVAAKQDRQVRLILGGTAAVLALAALLVATGALTPTVEMVVNNFRWVIFGVTIVFFAWLFLAGDYTPDERKRLVVITVLFLASAVFWMALEQAGSTLNLFAERNTENRIFGWTFPASWLQSVNSLFIVVFAPVFAAIWFKLGRRDPSSPAKFSFALFFVGGGFALMIAAAALSAGGARVSPLWLIFAYLLHTAGELCLSPVGMSATSKLAPARVAGLMMGVWFLGISIGNYLAGMAASFYETIPLPMLFGVVTAAAAAAALVMALLVKPIKRMVENA